MRQIVRQKKMVHYRQCQGHSEGYIFQTAGPFAIKLSLVVQHYKPECPAVKLGYCVQGEGRNEGLKCQ